METIQQAIIINAKDEILLLKCGKAFGKELADKWEFPNGFLDTDEKPEDDLKREVKNATGLTIEIIYQFYSSILKEGETDLFNVAYLCRLKNPKEKIKLMDDYAEHKWVKPKDIKKLKTTNSQVFEMADKAMQVLG